ncbi:hypothetical protein VPH166E361_0030 [Vibrio phage 166E36-1]
MKFTKKGYVYFIYDVRGNLCYIGQTTWLRSRMEDHFKNKLISKVVYYTYKDKPTIECVEAYMIDKYKPHLNKMNRLSLIEKGRELENSYIVGAREVDIFKSDLNSPYARMCLDYPEFPVDRRKFDREWFTNNKVHVYKVECASDPSISMMFYDWNGLRKVVVGKSDRKCKVPLSELRKVRNNLPKSKGTINICIQGVCNKVPKSILESLDEDQIEMFMRSRNTTVALI